MKHLILLTVLFTTNSFSSGSSLFRQDNNYKLKASIYSDGSVSGQGDKFIKFGPISFGVTSKRARDMFYTRIMRNPTSEQREMVCENTKRFGKYKYSFCRK